MGEYFAVYLDGAGEELDRLARGPDHRTIGAMEAALLKGFTITENRVHVITGELLASGHPETHHTEYVWSGQMNFAHNPGIFELARGDAPTEHHAYPGRHYFFDPGGHEFEKGVRQAFWDWITDWKGGLAPTGGLPWKSGGEG